MGKRTVLSGLAATLGASAMLLACMSGSASAFEPEPPYHFMMKNVQTGLCLDSDAQGKAYTKSCGNDNKYQRWTALIYNGTDHRLQNVQTNLCLQAGSGDSVVTAPCYANPPASQRWKWEYRENERNILTNVANGRALDSNQKGQLYTSPYSTSNPYMQWWEW